MFDSQRSTAGVNGTQWNSTPTPQWCLSLSAEVTSNKHCKQRRLLKSETKIKGLMSALSHRNTPLVPKCLLPSMGDISGHKQSTEAHLKRTASCTGQKEKNYHLLHVLARTSFPIPVCACVYTVYMFTVYSYKWFTTYVHVHLYNNNNITSGINTLSTYNLYYWDSIFWWKLFECSISLLSVYYSLLQEM